MDLKLLALKWNNHQKTFFHVLSELRSNELFTDATLTCDSKFFPVHKLVLSLCSDYFREIFQRTSCNSPVIVLKDIRHQDLAVLLDYMYLGAVEVRQTDLARLIEAAECLRVKGLMVSDENTPKSSKKRSSSLPENTNKKFKSTFPCPRNSVKAIDKSSYNQEVKISDSVFENELEANSSPIMDIKIENEVSQCESKFGSETQENFCDELVDDIKQKTVFHNNMQEAVKEGFDESMAGPSSMKEGSDLWNNVESSNSIPSSFLQPQSTGRGGMNDNLDDIICHSRNHYECRICSETFRAEWNINKHLASVHAIFKPYSCTYCDHKSSNKTHLKVHVLTHTGERPFSCQYCSYKAARKDTLRTHIHLNHITHNE